MKPITCICLLMSTISVSFAQVHHMAIPDLGKQQTWYDQPASPVHQKGGGDVIWQTSFNWKDNTSPRGWTLPAGWIIKDNADLGNNWIWRDDTLGGPYTSAPAPAHFATPSDGFICVPMAEYNFRDEILTYNKMDTYIMTPPIDCSSVSSVVVKFNQYFRFASGVPKIEMLVTNDDGVRWSSYDINFNLPLNTETPPEFQTPEINISDAAAGMSTVQIRFYVQGISFYYIMIDDLLLVEAFDYDLVLEDFWTDFNDGSADPEGHLNYIPYSQIGMAAGNGGKVGDFLMRGAFLNKGNRDQENVALHVLVLRNGVDYYNKTSSITIISPLDRDTLSILDPLRPMEYGDYEINLTAVSANNEEVPGNNYAKANFTINDSLYQYADFGPEGGISTGVYGLSKGGDIMAVVYDLKTPCVINSICAPLGRWYQESIPTLQFVLFKYMAEEDDYAEIMTSEVIDFDITRERLLFTLPLIKDGESEFLEPGKYLAGVRSWGIDGNGPGDTEGIAIGLDQSSKFPSVSALVYLQNKNDWYFIDKMPMIGFSINEHSGPREAPATFNVDMNRHIGNGEFHPGSDFVDVSGTFSNWTGSARLADPEADGIYTITLEGMPVGKDIEYKYRINGDWNTSEFPNGGPNRKYTVRYWNILNDIYNGGILTGVNQASQVASFSVYPNPASGPFTVEYNSPVATDLLITLTDIRGRSLYQNRVSGATVHREKINNLLPEGLYFLTLNDGKMIRVQKVVVK